MQPKSSAPGLSIRRSPSKGLNKPLAAGSRPAHSTAVFAKLEAAVAAVLFFLLGSKVVCVCIVVSHKHLLATWGEFVLHAGLFDGIDLTFPNASAGSFDLHLSRGEATLRGHEDVLCSPAPCIAGCLGR
jgi:hypothetical protein